MARHLSLVPDADARSRVVALAPCCPLTGAGCPHVVVLPVRVGEVLAATRRVGSHAATPREDRDRAALAHLVNGIVAGLDARARHGAPGSLAA